MQIRKWMPSELKPHIKLANPNLFNILAEHYHDSCEVLTNALIKELFSIAGEDWSELLNSQEAPQPKSRIKVYRGKTTLEAKPAQITKDTNTPTKSTRFYRGVAITN